MKKAVNLKQRLDELRGESAAPVMLTLHLDADLYRAVQTRARRAQVSPETYIAQVLTHHLASGE